MSSRSTSGIWRSLHKTQTWGVESWKWTCTAVYHSHPCIFLREDMDSLLHLPSQWHVPNPLSPDGSQKIFLGIRRFTYSSLRRLLDLVEWDFLRFFSPAPASSSISSSRSDILYLWRSRNKGSSHDRPVVPVTEHYCSEVPTVNNSVRRRCLSFPTIVEYQRSLSINLFSVQTSTVDQTIEFPTDYPPCSAAVSPVVFYRRISNKLMKHMHYSSFPKPAP